MLRSLRNIFWLATKEVRSFLSDYVLLALVIYTFTFAVFAMAQSTAQEVYNAAIAIADEDHSQLSAAIARDFLPPYFKPARLIDVRDIDRLLDTAAYTFIIDIPPHFERDVRAGRMPAVQVNVDATASMQAGIGAGYVQQILSTEIARHTARSDQPSADAVTLAVHLAFNPNATPGWFMSIMGIINNITMLAIILSGAAVIREREHGTMDHLLTMPLSPLEIALAKVMANGFVITIAAALSLYLVVRGLLAIPIAGSIPLFLCGVTLYLFFASAVGLFLATLARSMPQLGLLFMLVNMPMQMLSGSNTPLDSEPRFLQILMQGVASTHFVSFAQAILYRGAGLSLVWPDFLAVAGLGMVFFVLAVLRFRRISAVSLG
ncbi:MAG TPA: ABC transporter permease [Acetobacteraceae bacterium]|nr:ABC transporter permease [Acetobacteraceae bacterium]